MITQVKKAVTNTNPKCDLEIKRLHLYYDIKLLNFGMDDNSDLIIQCPVFVQHYSQLPLEFFSKQQSLLIGNAK